MRLPGERLSIEFGVGSSSTITLGTSLRPIPISSIRFGIGEEAISWTTDGYVTFNRPMDVLTDATLCFRNTASTSGQREIRLFKNDSNYACSQTYMPGSSSWVSAHVGPSFNHFDAGDTLCIGITSCYSGDVLYTTGSTPKLIIMEV